MRQVGITPMLVSVAALVLSVAAIGITGWQMVRQPVRCLTLLEAKNEAYSLNEELPKEGRAAYAEWRKKVGYPILPQPSSPGAYWKFLEDRKAQDDELNELSNKAKLLRLRHFQLGGRWCVMR
jgi:hypothetical protein